MQYLLTLYADEAGWSKMSTSEHEQAVAAYMAYGEALRAAGAFVGSTACSQSQQPPRCAPSTARRRCWMAPTSIRRSSLAAII